MTEGSTRALILVYKCWIKVKGNFLIYSFSKILSSILRKITLHLQNDIGNFCFKNFDQSVSISSSRYDPLISKSSRILTILPSQRDSCISRNLRSIRINQTEQSETRHRCCTFFGTAKRERSRFIQCINV